MNLPTVFKSVSFIFVAVATYFLLVQSDRETTFVIATLGAVAFFLGIRFEIRERQKKG